MKKFSAIVLAIALVLMMSVPFSASAASTFVIPTVKTEGAAEVTVEITYEQTDWICNGKVQIEFDAEKAELVVPTEQNKAGETVEAPNKMSKLPTAVVNTNDKAEGKVVVAFASTDKIAETGNVITMTFKLKEGVAVGDEIAISLSTDEWVDTESANMAEEAPITAAGKIVVTEKATEATTTATEPTTTATTATTKKPTTAGEATPWALLATVTVAGAALVVLSTKKSK